MPTEKTAKTKSKSIAELAQEQVVDDLEKKVESASNLAKNLGETKKNNGKKPIIDVQNVNKTFLVGKNEINVLKQVNTQIFPEEFIVILGPSGSGKSTLMNSILGLEPPSTGKVIVKGENLADKKPNILTKFRYRFFGIVFQRPEWIRSLTVLQNVAMPLALNSVPKKERQERAMQKLKDVGMDDHADYFPTELSGGQQQKVTLARALINEPDIIVADEPTGNLDTKSADRVMNMFKDLNEKQHKTVLMVTHNIDYVRYASRTIYIRDGRVVQGADQMII